MALKKLFFSRKSKPFSASTPPNTDDNSTISNGCFDCNICLDLVRDPVVTLCGHLYCWPCIYEWFHVQTSSSVPPGTLHPMCPVCKTQLSPNSLVPLYGRGQTPQNETSQDDQQANKENIATIPPRPTSRSLLNPNGPQIPFHGTEGREYFHPPQQYEEIGVGGNGYSFSYDQGRMGIGNPLGVSVAHPMLEMFVEMFHARAFGNSGNLYPHTSNAHLGLNNARSRRHELQADRSLNRISVFLLCCFILCLILF